MTRSPGRFAHGHALKGERKGAGRKQAGGFDLDLPLAVHLSVFRQPTLIPKMSRPEEEELVDYDEAAEESFAPAPVTSTADAGKAEGDKKGSYVGIHSTGFR